MPQVVAAFPTIIASLAFTAGKVIAAVDCGGAVFVLDKGEKK